MNERLNKRFHKFLTETGQMEDKAEIVEAISQGRTRSSRELADNEVEKYLAVRQHTPAPLKRGIESGWTPKGGKVCDTKRKKIIAIFRSMGYGVDRAKQWAENLRGFGKPFNDYTSEELSKIIAIAEREQDKIIQQINPNK